jgi:hypothetical protein
MSNEADTVSYGFSRWVLNTGFIFGLVLAAACLYMAAHYMLTYEEISSRDVTKVVEGTMQKGAGAKSDSDYKMIRMALTTNMYIARVLLISCGMFIGLSFGFLGFCLFLFGVKGDVDASLEATVKYKIQLARLSPGLFVILCATIIVSVCLTRNLPVSLSQKTTSDDYAIADSIHKDSIKPELPSTPDLEMPGK